MRLEELEDVTYEAERGLAWITINRPERHNAFRNRTIDELIFCFKRAWADPEVGVVALTGAGDRAFCAGGDQKQRQETGDYGPSESGLMETETLHRTIRDIPKPVIAAVNGVAVGGGHVLHVLCDLPIAADHALFGPGQCGSPPGRAARRGAALGGRDAGAKPDRPAHPQALLQRRLGIDRRRRHPGLRHPGHLQRVGRGQGGRGGFRREAEA